MYLEVTLYITKCKCCGRQEYPYSSRINCDLNEIANEAGIYDYLFNPETSGINSAKQLIKHLKKAIKTLQNNGTHSAIIDWLKTYLNACIKFPEAKVITYY